MSVAMFTRWKNYMIAGVDQMSAHAPTSIAGDIAVLKVLVESLPIELEAWNKEHDRPYQVYIQQNVMWRVDLLFKMAGIDPKFAHGAWTCIRYCLSLVREIEADDDLLEIAKKMEDIATQAIESVLHQNTGTVYAAVYAFRSGK